MTDTKISELPVASVIASPDVAPVVRAGVTMQADVSLFGGSFLASNIARVDPMGNDSTGILGNLTRPFKTVQAALDAIVSAAMGGSINGFIDIGANNFTENLSTDLTGINTAYISFRGVRGHGSGDFQIFQSLEITGGATTEVYFENCVLGGGNIDCSSTQLFLYAHNVEFSGTIVNFTGSGTCSVGSRSNSSGGVFQVNADSASQIAVFGLWSPSGDVTTISSASPNAPTILLNGCNRVQVPENNNLTLSQFSIDAPDAVVTAIQSIVLDLTCSSVTLIDSHVAGTNSAGSTTYADIFLNPAFMDFSTLPTSLPTRVGAAWIDTTGGFNILKVKL